MQLQALEAIGDYLQGVRQAVEESGNEELIRDACEAAGKTLFQTMTAAENEEPPIWYLKKIVNETVYSTPEERKEAIEELKDRRYNEAPTEDQKKTALLDMIDSVESAAYDLLKACGIYSRIPTDEFDGEGVISDFSGEVENSTRGILEAIIKADELGERFLFSLFWNQFNAPEDQDSPEQQAND